MKNLVDVIVKAWMAGYKIYYPKLGRVLLIKSYIPQVIGSEGRGILQSVLGPKGPSQQIEEKIEWTFPGRPSIDSRHILFYLDNIEGRKISIGFSKYDEIKAVIGQSTEVEINDQRLVVRQGDMEISMEFLAKSTAIRNGANQIQGTTAGWQISGPTTFTDQVTFLQKVTAGDEVTAAGKISSGEDVLAGSISLKNHQHGYIDSDAGTPTPKVTDPPVGV